MLTLEQLKLRKSGIGGSDIAAILLPDSYRDIIDVYKDKISEEIVEIEESQKMHWGSVLEEPIAQEYEKQTGNEVLKVKDELLIQHLKPNIKLNSLIFRHPDYKWAIGNIDRFYKTADGQYGILEIKTTSKHYMSGWKYDVPMEYYCQVQHYMWIAKALGLIQLDISHIAILASGQDFTIVPVPLDQKYLDNAVPKLDKFWNENVLAKVPPEPVTGEQVEKLYTSQADKEIEGTKEVVNLVKKLAETQSIIKSLELTEKNYKDQIQVIMKDAELLSFQGDLLATWKYQPEQIVKEFIRKAHRRFLCKLQEKKIED